MSGPINRLTVGLLDFFGLKGSGRYPNELLDQIRATVDLLDWHVAQNSTVLAFSLPNIVANTAAVVLDITLTTPVDLTTGGQLIVPSDEVWYVQCGDINWGLDDASQIVDVGFTYRSGGGAVGVGGMFDMSDVVGYTTGAAAPARAGRRSITRPMWLTPGSIIQLFMAGATRAAGTITFAGSLRIGRFKR